MGRVPEIMVTAMLRTFALACISLCITVSHVHAKTRDNTLVYVLLGLELGDTINTEDGHRLAMQSATRVDQNTIDVVITEDGAPETVRIREELECVFDWSTINVQGNKFHHKYNFNNIVRYNMNGRFDELWGKNVYCNPIEGACMNRYFLATFYAPKEGWDERHHRAFEYFRSEYCPGSPY